MKEETTDPTSSLSNQQPETYHPQRLRPPESESELTPAKSSNLGNKSEAAKPNHEDDKEGLKNDTQKDRPSKSIPVKTSDPVRPPGPVLRAKKVAPKHETATPTKEETAVAQSPSKATTAPTTPPKPLERRNIPFSERYERITTYLEKLLFERVHELHRQGEFSKISHLMNAAIMEYLKQHYPTN